MLFPVVRILAVIAVTSMACFSQTQSWKNLINPNDLSNWDTYIGPSYDTLKNDWDGKPIGLNTDPKNIFSIVQAEGNPVLRISGEQFGGISTKDEFGNYHLRFEFRWGKYKSHPKKNDKRDSGLLYHAVGDHGADYGFWMRSQEFQLQEGDCGDYWGVAGGSFEIRAKKDQKGYIYDPQSDLLLFNERSPHGRRCIKSPDAEKPSGEWNVAELYCLGGKAVHIMNGQVVMILEKSSQLEGGKLVPLTKGKIQLQSEGSELFFRNMEIRSIEKLPDHLK